MTGHVMGTSAIVSLNGRGTDIPLNALLFYKRFVRITIYIDEII